MQITVTARHLELTEALHNYAVKKVKKIQKYFTHIIDAHMVLSLRKYRHISEVIIHGPGVTISGKEEADDMYSAIDLVMEDIERQLKRHKEKLKAKSRFHRAMRRSQAKTISEGIMPEESIELSEKEPVAVSEIRKFDVKPMDFDEAIAQMQALKLDHWAFVNKETNKVNFVYKKDDGDYGIIEPNY